LYADVKTRQVAVLRANYDFWYGIAEADDRLEPGEEPSRNADPVQWLAELPTPPPPSARSQILPGVPAHRAQDRPDGACDHRSRCIACIRDRAVILPLNPSTLPLWAAVEPGMRLALYEGLRICGIGQVLWRRGCVSPLALDDETRFSAWLQAPDDGPAPE